MTVRLSGWFSLKSMKGKLTIIFSTTIIFFLLLALVLLSYFVSVRHYENFVYTATQSGDQAYSFIQKYLDNMTYASDMIYYNSDLQSILSSDDFTGNRKPDVQYREFLELGRVFNFANLNSLILFARIYIPDDIYYSNNITHFAPKSIMEKRKDYQQFRKLTKSGGTYFSASEKITIPGHDYNMDIVSMFRVIRSVSGSAQEIGIEQIGVRTADLQKVLEKSNTANQGMVYLTNQNSELITYSLGKSVEAEAVLQPHDLPKYSGVDGWKDHTISEKNYIVQQRFIESSGWTITTMILKKEIYADNQEITIIIFGLTILAVFVTFVASYFISKTYTSRLSHLVDIMGEVQNGNLAVKLEDNQPDEIGELEKRFKYMMNEIEKLMDEQYKSGKAVKSAQLKALQAQINPHFLYNTLDLINWEAMDHDAPEIAKVSQNLAKFYRISLNKGREIVTVQEELQLVQAYVQIENCHFEDAIHLKIDVPEELMKYSCLNIILQPLVENSIMHSLAEDSSVIECNISLQAYLSDGDLVFKIADDGKGISEQRIQEIMVEKNQSAKSNGYGVRNINTRLTLYYGEEYGLRYTSIVGEGTEVMVKIPAILFDKEDSNL